MDNKQWEHEGGLKEHPDNLKVDVLYRVVVNDGAGIQAVVGYYTGMAVMYHNTAKGELYLGFLVTDPDGDCAEYRVAWKQLIWFSKVRDKCQ